jgi:hypothetical protein
MASILLEIGNKYTDEREKQFYLFIFGKLK